MGGANLVRSMPATAALYSSIVGVRPRTEERTTTGVEERRDSPFLRSESSTTRPWKRRVEVAMTVSPLAAFSWLPMQRLQPGRSRYIMFWYSVRAVPFGSVSLNSKPEYFWSMSQSPSALSSSMML